MTHEKIRYDYRYVTYTMDSNGKWKVKRMTYTPVLNYSKRTTGLDNKAKLGTYYINIDKNLGRDIYGKSIYDNDLLIDAKNNVYKIIKKNCTRYLLNTQTNKTLDISELKAHEWQLIGNLYKNLQN